MEGMITRKVELRGIGIFSTFKIYFAITLIFSLVSFILFNLFGMQLVAQVAGWIGSLRQFLVDLQTRFPAVFENEILMSLFISILNGFVVGVICAIGSAIFSFFAMLLGGVSIKIREKSPEKKTPYL